jgi:hypothetical protein
MQLHRALPKTGTREGCSNGEWLISTKINWVNRETEQSSKSRDVHGAPLHKCDDYTQSDKRVEARNRQAETNVYRALSSGGFDLSGQHRTLSIGIVAADEYAAGGKSFRSAMRYELIAQHSVIQLRLAALT